MVLSARATRSAVELAICVTRRSTVMAWLISTAPTNIAAMIGTTSANSMAATPRVSPARLREADACEQAGAGRAARHGGDDRAQVWDGGGCTATGLSVVGLRAERHGGLHQQRAVAEVAHLEERQLAAELPGIADGDQHHRAGGAWIEGGRAAWLTMVPLLAQLGSTMPPKLRIALDDAPRPCCCSRGRSGALAHRGLLEGGVLDPRWWSAGIGALRPAAAGRCGWRAPPARTAFSW